MQRSVHLRVLLALKSCCSRSSACVPDAAMLNTWPHFGYKSTFTTNAPDDVRMSCHDSLVAGWHRLSRGEPSKAE